MKPVTLAFSLLAAGLLGLSCQRNTPVPGSRWVEPTTGMEFVYVPGGRFYMGSPASEPGRQVDEVEHEVVLRQGFYLGKYEVTQGEWETVMGSRPFQFPECGRRCPAETVNFHEVQRFLRRLEELSPGEVFRLPTEAEWEHSCRAGSTSAFTFGDTLESSAANYDGRYPPPGTPPGPYLGRPAPVGSYPPNRLGLHDLHGNVWEWCQDWYGPYELDRRFDPTGLNQGQLRVIRGGSWAFDGNSSRCALRYTHAEKDRGFSIGFRVLRVNPVP